MGWGMRWFAVYTLCHHERKVGRQLRTAGIETFLPEIEVLSRRWDRRRIIQKPLFPGYLFVNIAPVSLKFLDIVKTPGVCYILGSNGKPESIPEEEINSLKILLSERREISRYPYLKKGDKVRIISGSLKGAVGILISEDQKKRRLVVSIELMRRSVSAQLYEEEVEPF